MPLIMAYPGREVVAVDGAGAEALGHEAWGQGRERQAAAAVAPLERLHEAHVHDAHVAGGARLCWPVHEATRGGAECDHSHKAAAR